MKTRLATIFSALIAPVLLAQEPTPVASPTATPAATPAPQPTAAAAQPAASGTAAMPEAAAPAASPDSNQLFSEPNSEPNLENAMLPTEGMPEISQPGGIDHMPAGGPVFRRTKTSESVEQMNLRIRLRQAKTRALVDPKVQEALERADAAKTEPERREALRDYYKTLYDRMVRIDSSVKKSADLLKAQYLQRLDDSHIGLAREGRNIRRL
jgi:hypothetical protein